MFRSIAASLYCKHNGGLTAARNDFAQNHAHLLVPGQNLPSLIFFKRNAEKLLTHQTVENLVSLLVNLSMVLWKKICCIESKKLSQLLLNNLISIYFWPNELTFTHSTTEPYVQILRKPLKCTPSCVPKLRRKDYGILLLGGWPAEEIRFHWHIQLFSKWHMISICTLTSKKQ